MNVGAVALEQPVVRHREENIEIARRRAAQARFALAGETDARAFLDAGGNVDAERALAPHAALAAARLARLLDDLALAVTARTGALDGEEALLRANLALAATGRA